MRAEKGNHMNIANPLSPLVLSQLRSDDIPSFLLSQSASSSPFDPGTWKKSLQLSRSSGSPHNKLYPCNLHYTPGPLLLAIPSFNRYGERLTKPAPTVIQALGRLFQGSVPHALRPLPVSTCTELRFLITSLSLPRVHLI